MSAPERTVEELVASLELLPHPEGGWYRETWRAVERIPASALPERFPGERAAGTSILFLLRQGFPSRLHRIRSDEIWHFHLGASLDLHLFHPDGRSEIQRLGALPGEHFQLVAPAGAWFGAETRGAYTLVGCTVAPGFDFADFELAEAEALESRWPAERERIRRLSP